MNEEFRELKRTCPGYYVVLNNLIYNIEKGIIKMENNILLIGFMGAGKTTVSRELTKLTGMEEIDMDAYIVEKEGMSINDMFAQHGEEYFRKKETECLIEIMQSKNRIVSCGGGVVVKDENVEHMKAGGTIVLLTATPETTLERVKNSTDRPILNGNMNVEFITELMNKRKDRYLAVADVIVATDNKSVSEICAEIMDKISKK